MTTLPYIVIMVARKRGGASMPRTSTTGWIVLAVVVIFSVILSLLFSDADDWGELITMVLSYVVGVFVGSFLMLGAFRLFGWGESAAGSVVLWSWIGGTALIMLALVVLDDALRPPQPYLALITLWTGLGGFIGAVGRAVSIRRELRTEHRP